MIHMISIHCPFCNLLLLHPELSSHPLTFHANCNNCPGTPLLFFADHILIAPPKEELYRLMNFKLSLINQNKIYYLTQILFPQNSTFIQTVESGSYSTVFSKKQSLTPLQALELLRKIPQLIAFA